MSKMNDLARILARHSSSSADMQQTVIPRLQIYRADRPTGRVPGLYRPAVCIIASGQKEVLIGGKKLRYENKDCFVVTVDLPVIGTIIKATPSSPYLAFCLELHIPTLAAIAIRSSEIPETSRAADHGLLVGTANDDLIDSAIRLTQLLDTPKHIEILAPLYEQEFLYRLYTGIWGRQLHAVSQANSRMSQVSRAVAWIHEHFATEFSADSLARISGMSVSTMNRYFREITSMSPLEYQKRIRLHEARRLLATELSDVSGAGHRVGYSSPSQFNREYRRLFGEPPGKNASRMRTETV